MTWININESEWRSAFIASISGIDPDAFDFVTGPGRSGAVASVYASHYLGIPYKPHKAGNYDKDASVLIVDTVEYTGRTLRKAISWYQRKGLFVDTAFALKETRGHYYKMWYEVQNDRA